MSARPPLLVISGTTASGKDRAGAMVARALGTEVISLDSMKVYRGMEIGTDKPGQEERAMARWHLIDIVDPREPMNLRRFTDLACAAREDVVARGLKPLAVGGTALYLTGFLRGVLEGPEADPALRARLRAEAAGSGVAALHARLLEVDPAAAARIHPNDYKRIERALEVHALTGQRISALQGQWSAPPAWPYRLVVITHERATLSARIASRIDRMIDEGLVAEVQAILSGGGFGAQSLAALGYKEIVDHLEGRCTLVESVRILKHRTWQFAKRQLTWFRKMPEAVWITRQEGDTPESVVARILEIAS